MKSVLDRTGNVGQLLIGWGPQLESNPNTLVWFSKESALCVCVTMGSTCCHRLHLPGETKASSKVKWVPRSLVGRFCTPSPARRRLLSVGGLRAYANG